MIRLSTDYPRARRDRRYSTAAWRKVREQVRARDGHTCQGCARIEPKPGPRRVRGFVADHKVPPHLGGPFFELSNLQLLCWACSNRKAGQTDEAWRSRARPMTRRETPPTEAPRLIPERRNGRPASSDRDYPAWAMSLHGVSEEPA